MPFSVQIFCCLLPCKNVVVIDVNGLIGILVCFSYQYIKKTFIIKVFDDGVLLFGVEDNKTICLSVPDHSADGLQDLLIVLSRDNRSGIILMVTELADSADYFQIKRIFEGFPGGRGQDNACSF